MSFTLSLSLSLSLSLYLSLCWVVLYVVCSLSISLFLSYPIVFVLIALVGLFIFSLEPNGVLIISQIGFCFIHLFVLTTKHFSSFFALFLSQHSTTLNLFCPIMSSSGLYWTSSLNCPVFTADFVKPFLILSLLLNNKANSLCCFGLSKKWWHYCVVLGKMKPYQVVGLEN